MLEGVVLGSSEVAERRRERNHLYNKAFNAYHHICVVAYSSRVEALTQVANMENIFSSIMSGKMLALHKCISCNSPSFYMTRDFARIFFNTTHMIEMAGYFNTDKLRI